MACPEPTGCGFCPLGLLHKDVTWDPRAGCCADLAFNKAAFARASPLAVRQIFTRVPLAWAVALSLRRMALRRATLRLVMALLLGPVPLLDRPESVAAEDGSMGTSQLAACCWMLRDT